MAPVPVGKSFIGFYESTDIVKHETGELYNEGLAEWKIRLEGYHSRNMHTSSSYLEHGARRT